jgi:hypothetical protein
MPSLSLGMSIYMQGRTSCATHLVGGAYVDQFSRQRHSHLVGMRRGLPKSFTDRFSTDALCRIKPENLIPFSGWRSWAMGFLTEINFSGLLQTLCGFQRDLSKPDDKRRNKFHNDC